MIMANPCSLIALGCFLLLLSIVHSGYIITVPKDVHPGRETPVCFTFHNSRAYIKISLKLRVGLDTYFFKRKTIGYSRYKCIYFIVPNDKPSGLHTLSVVGDTPGTVVMDTYINFNVKDPVLTFVQTDKPAYKPGQTMRFRILATDVDLKPSNQSISKIQIKDPESVIMRQWLNQTSDSGLLSFEFPISKEPVVGDWVIETTMGSTTTTTKFEIKEYVLPKFEVTLTPPLFITVESETIDGEVCAWYTYGQAVKGRVKLSVCIEGEVVAFTNSRPCIFFNSEIDGCHKFSMKTKQLELKNKKFRIDKQVVNVTASVLDNATGLLIHSTTSKTIVSLMDVFLDMKSHSEPFYKPGLPYYVKVKATRLNGEPAVGVKLGIRAEELKLTKEVITDKKGFGIYVFPAMMSDQTEIVFKVISLDVEYREDVADEYNMIIPGTSMVIEPWYSPTRSYLKITPLQEVAPCNKAISLEVSVTQAPSKLFKVYMQIVSRGKIVSTIERVIARRDRVEDGCQEGFKILECIYRNNEISRKFGDVRVEQFLVDVTFSDKMIPSAQIVMYYVKDFGEVISDVVDVKVETCERNPVNLAFGTDEEYPGYETSLTLQAAPGSVCGVGVIDKSITLLGEVNSITQAQLLKSTDRFKVDLLDPLDPGYKTNKEYCEKWLSQHEPHRRLITSWSDKTDPKIIKAANTEKVSIISSGWYADDEDGVYYMVEHADALQAFKAAGLLVITDLEIETRPCKEVWKKPYLFNDAYSGDESYDTDVTLPVKKEKKQASIRDYFPETWLWDLEVVGDSGELVMTKKLPHSITQWIGNAICTHKKKGVGISNDAAITTFQPFFASFNLPYSSIRGEFIPVKVTTFNYLSECVEIKLELKESESIDIDPDVGSVTFLCICSNEARSHNFIIIPRKIGSINLTVIAEAINGDEKCSGVNIGENAVGVKDTVVRPLLVEPEGTEKEYTYGSLVCPEESENGQYRNMVDLPIPHNHVSDSARGFISLIGDLMGPSLNSATGLLKLPYGCGEQNMIVFAPNIYIMKYTKSSQQSDGLDQQSIEKYLVAGYQRELRYKHLDGSYSAFGESDESGSTWLTAFVAKSFQKASEFIYIDKEIINAAFKWLRKLQYRDGCIVSVGRVIHNEMRGGVTGENPGLLSVYVFIAMLESEYSATDSYIVKGLKCLMKHPANSTYTLVLYTYFAAMYKPGQVWHQSLLKQLEDKAITQDNMMFWKKLDTHETVNRESTPYGKATANDIETTAYALLAYQTDPRPAYVKMLKIVRWLTKQQNPNGGFISTQDTVVALQALSGYAALMFKGSPSLSVFVDTFDYTKTYNINSTNSMVQHTSPIIAFPTSITVIAKGTGCGVLQATVRYNVMEDRDPKEAFHLDVTVNPSMVKPTNCKQRSLSICTSYIGEGNSSNMAVILAKMPTGWLADMYTVDRLQQSTTLLRLKRTEVDNLRPDVVNFYFDELDRDKVCFKFEIVQDVEVKNLKPAYVKVYDYYDPDLKVQEFFEISPDCSRPGSKPEKESKDTTVDIRTPEEIEFGTQAKNMFYERNLIDNSFITRSTTLAPGQTTAKISLVKCPTCEDMSLKKLVFTVCESQVVYTAMSLGRNKLQILRDLKPSKKIIIRTAVTYQLPPGCDCHITNIRKNSKVLILMKKSSMVDIKKTGKLLLDSNSTVLLLTRTLQKAVSAAKRSRYCRGDKPRKKSSKISTKKSVKNPTKTTNQ